MRYFRPHRHTTYYSLVLSGALSVSFIARTLLGGPTTSVQVLVLYELLLYPVVIGAFLRRRTASLSSQRPAAAGVATIIAATAGLYGGVLAGVGHLLFSGPSILSTLQHTSFAVGSLLVTGLLLASPILLPAILHRLNPLDANRTPQVRVDPTAG